MTFSLNVTISCPSDKQMFGTFSGTFGSSSEAGTIMRVRFEHDGDTYMWGKITTGSLTGTTIETTFAGVNPSNICASTPTTSGHQRRLVLVVARPFVSAQALS